MGATLIHFIDLRLKVVIYQGWDGAGPEPAIEGPRAWRSFAMA